MALKPRVKIEKYSKIKNEGFSFYRKEYISINKNKQKFEDFIWDIVLKLSKYEPRAVKETLFLYRNFILYGYKNYYFQNNDLIEFLKNTDVKSNNINPNIILDNYTHKEKETIYFNEKTKKVGTRNNLKILNGVIHSKELKRSIMFMFQIHGTNKENIDFFITDGEDDFYTPFDNEKELIKFLNNNKETYIHKIAYNFLNYLIAFPESIIDGPPADAILERKTESSITVKSNDTVKRITKEFSSHYTSPHLRRGHFRFLKSDRFKNKKGQIIYIEPTFIKGSAKTVIKENNQ